jgi:ATP-binding protein involved in chromosome partitioning
MADITQSQVEAAIKDYTEPSLGQDLVSAGCIENIEIKRGRVSVAVELGFPAAQYGKELENALNSRIQALDGVKKVTVDIASRIAAHTAQQGVAPLEGIKNIIAIASGKGGVGKSTTAANLALALAAEGASTGLLDADIYGPSQPRMLGVTDKPTSPDGKHIEPLVGHGVQSMSIGYLVDQDTAMVWRGPMVTQALQQLLNDTSWRDLDYLVVDMPPGTGDIQLTLAQKVPVSGSVIITTPQDIALQDALKGMRMFEKVNVPVLGLVENMAVHVCSQCGHEEHIFGEGGGARLAADHGMALLGSLPLERAIQQQTDGGTPTVVADPEGKSAAIYREIARKIAARLSLKAKEDSGQFPNIVVEDS